MLSSVLAIANFVILLLTIIGGYVVIRSSIAKAESDVQERVREGLKAENELLMNRVARLEGDNKKLERQMQSIVTMLKKIYGISLEVDGDVVSFRDKNGRHTTQIDSDQTA